MLALALPILLHLTCSPPVPRETSWREHRAWQTACVAEPPHQQSTPAPAPPPAGRPLTLTVSAGSVLDNNINHDASELGSYGMVVGAGAWYRDDPADPNLEIVYQLALHEYSATDRWDRVSHYARANWEYEITDRWRLETVGELSLKGTFEDRELSNQYVVNPRLEFRIDRAHRIRVYGTYRLRRYEEVDRGRNAKNRYVGAEFRQYSERGDRWETGLRYEVNDTELARFAYTRWTYSTGYSAPLRSLRDHLDLEVRYRFLRYPSRLVEVDDRDVPRRDYRLIPSVGWRHSVNSGLDLRTEYTFETRGSNDLDREFAAHRLSFSVDRRW